MSAVSAIAAARPGALSRSNQSWLLLRSGGWRVSRRLQMVVAVVTIITIARPRRLLATALMHRLGETRVRAAHSANGIASKAGSVRLFTCLYNTCAVQALSPPVPSSTQFNRRCPLHFQVFVTVRAADQAYNNRTATLNKLHLERLNKRCAPASSDRHQTARAEPFRGEPSLPHGPSRGTVPA